MLCSNIQDAVLIHGYQCMNHSNPIDMKRSLVENVTHC